MAQLSHTLEKVLLCDPERNTSLVHIHVPESTPVEFRTLGQLFFIVEIDRQLPINQELVGVVEEEMQKAYYQTAQLRVEPAFEQALQHVNEQLYQLIEGGVTEWLEHFNIVVGIVKDDLILFAHLGNISAVLIHGGRVTDIIANAGREREKVNPLKIFSTVVSGTITDGDHILFYTPSVLDYLSQEKLKRIVLERTPDEAVHQLDVLLDEASHHAAFGLLLLHSTRERETVHLQTTRTTTPRAPMHTQSSMEHLIARERSTDRLLAPSFWLTARQITSAITQNIRSTFGRIRSTQKTTRRPYLGTEHSSPASEYAMPQRESSGTKAGLQSIARISTRSGKAVGRSLQSTFAKRQQWFDFLKAVPSGLGRVTNRFVRNFLAWSFTRKAIFFAIIIVLFFFAQSIVSIGRRGAVEEAQRQETEAVAAIEEKTFQAEASLSYEDEARANTLLDEAEALIAALENKDTDAVRSAQNEINTLREQANRVVRISEPTTLADLSQQDGFTSTRFINALADTLYLPDQNGSKMWAVDGNGNVVGIDTGIDGLGAPTMSALQGGQSIIVYHDNGAVYAINAANTIQLLSFTPPSESKDFVAMSTYQSRVYILDKLNNQIYRSLQGSAAIGTASEWLDANYDLSQSVDLAVDGTIYVADESGAVREFSQGTQDDFTLQDITPAVNHIDRIWTDAEANNLYILDRNEKRLLVFTKNGRLRQQYTSEAWDDLRAMSIDEANDIAYLLSGTKIYTLELQ
ncbi:MAG: hypothetical protein H6760_02965 [Candidatus Nomurabacteria bacterium]|nr:MAG: hypothetical protein H6760_02965 [Candidatus Nomurabacteria bacterium]